MELKAKASFNLHPSAPYDFDLSFNFFINGDKQIRVLENHQYIETHRINGNPSVIVVKSSGTIAKPLLKAEIITKNKLTPSEKTKLKQELYGQFNLGMELNKFYRAIKKDRVLTKLVSKVKGLRFSKTD